MANTPAIEAAPEKGAVRIQIFSDVVCPWCYIGRRRLERALEQAPDVIAEIIWSPFELNPTMPPAGMDRRTYLEGKFGGREGVRAIEERVAAAGAAEGIDFAFDRIGRTPNTFGAHRLLWLARHPGRQDETAEALFHAYFSEGRDLGDRATLMRIGEEAGLPTNQSERMFDGDEGIEEVKREQALGHRLGIRGVPYFVLNERLAVSGAQPPETLVTAITRAMQIPIGKKETF